MRQCLTASWDRDLLSRFRPDKYMADRGRLDHAIITSVKRGLRNFTCQKLSNSSLELEPAMILFLTGSFFSRFVNHGDVGHMKIHFSPRSNRKLSILRFYGASPWDINFWGGQRLKWKIILRSRGRRTNG